MSCFKLPKGLIHELETMIWKFWWGYDNEGRKIHWVNWEHLCEAKENGGMEFKEIEKFNDALLAKQVWCMMHNPDSLCYKVFKARFFPNCSILEDNECTVGSYAWKSILSARDVVRKGMVWRDRNGQFVCIREDKCCLIKYAKQWLFPLFLSYLMLKFALLLILSQPLERWIKSSNCSHHLMQSWFSASPSVLDSPRIV